MVDIDERKILEAFLEEVKELLETLNQRLLDLENSPEDTDVINEIFRLTHSIKSESALVGYKKISTLAHKMEDIFERVRRNVLLVNTEIMDALFAAFDRIMKCLSAVENGENEDGEVWFYRYSENPDDPNEEPELGYIEDDDEYELVADAFDEFLDSVEYDEIVEEE